MGHPLIMAWVEEDRHYNGEDDDSTGSPGLLSGVVAVAGLDEESLLVEGEIDLVVAAGGGVLGGGVAETVLGAQLFGDLVVDLGYFLIFLDLEEAAAGL